MMSTYGQSVEPIKFVMKLLLGAFLAVCSLIILIHWFMYISLKVDGKPIKPFINAILEGIEASPAAFLATVLFVLIGYYLILSAVRGNVKFGIRFFFVSFYPIVPKETFVNAFMANCLVLNIWITALTHLMTMMFRGYLRGTQVAKIFTVQVSNMYFFGRLFKSSFFTTFLLVWWFIAFIYFVLKPVEKIDLGNKVKRADLEAK